jgi:heme/copper-type cytochrome/quinol oxidase subunit 1
VIRAQLTHATGGFVSEQTYNEVYSIHGSSMVWLVVIPLVTGGFGNLVFPLQIGARDVAFPWLNMLSFWIFPVAGLMLFSSFLMGAPTAGWMEYPPVSLQGAAGTSMWCAAIFLVGVSSTITGINFVVTILKMRARSRERYVIRVALRSPVSQSDELFHSNMTSPWGAAERKARTRALRSEAWISSLWPSGSKKYKDSPSL